MEPKVIVAVILVAVLICGFVVLQVKNRKK